MQTNERTNEKQESIGKSANTFCCGTERLRGMPHCCRSMWEGDDCRSMMSKGMRACRWFPLVPVIIGIALFLHAYYLNPEATRVMWMILAGIPMHGACLREASLWRAG